MNEYAKLKLRRRERDSLVTPSDFLCGPDKELPCHAVAATPPPARPRPVLTRTSHMQVLHTRTNEEGDRRGRRTRTDGLTDLSDACRPCIPEPLSPQCGECHVMNRRQSVMRSCPFALSILNDATWLDRPTIAIAVRFWSREMMRADVEQ